MDTLLLLLQSCILGCGVISPSGTFTATDTGTIQVSATHVPSSMVGYTTIVVRPAQVTINECATPKPAWIWCDDFEVDRLRQYGEVGYAGGRFGRFANVGRDGSAAMKGTYNPDRSLGDGSAGWMEVNFGRIPRGPPSMGYAKPVDAGTADYRQIYWRFFVRTDMDWEGGHGEKMTRLTAYANSNRAQAMAAYGWAHNSRPAQFLIQGMSGTDSAGNLRSTRWNDTPNWRQLGTSNAVTPVIPTRNEWVCLEFMVKLNDAGQSNGSMTYWKNDVQEARLANVNWLGVFSAYAINAVRLENWWSTAPTATFNPPKVQSRYFDNFVVSTERIGCTAR
jgi:hypothetical protein